MYLNINKNQGIPCKNKTIVMKREVSILFLISLDTHNEIYIQIIFWTLKSNYLNTNINFLTRPINFVEPLRLINLIISWLIIQSGRLVQFQIWTP